MEGGCEVGLGGELTGACRYRVGGAVGLLVLAWG